MELYAAGRYDSEPFKMNEHDIIQLYGEDVQYVKNAFLSSDSTCNNNVYSLEEHELDDDKKNLSGVLVEYKIKISLLQSSDGVKHLFFCTNPKSVDIARMLEIPEGKDKTRVYFMMPLLVLCLGLSATFSGLNLAIMSFSINDLKLIQESDSDKLMKQRAMDVMRLRRNSNFVLVTIIFGNCFCNISITLLMNYFAEFYGFGGFIFVELISTALLLIFTEILPSLIFTKNALAIASRLQYFVIFTMCITSPISYPLAMLLNIILGKENADDSAPLDLDALQIDELEDEEAADGNNFHEMMSVVKKTIKLREKLASDVMTEIDKVGMYSEHQQVTHSFLLDAYEQGHSRLPVYEGETRNKIRGVLNITDMMLLMDDEGRGSDTDLTLGTMLSVLEKRRKHCFVLDTMPVEHFMSELQQGCPMAIVVRYKEVDSEEDGTEIYEVCGIVTLEDCIEEILGEIFDEKDARQE
ncbi:Metal transporter cnnm-4 [Caenorhabditis elegans]|uniref:Metal transporter cnnm-4 n=1 Tax=Caenorhabditis elegans TaxID=6239 RepID=CNNM4_CAEEL|nr:Metal transporter cnnm-4 [Caenorhabditis elegans]Q17586.3 RecName: Full=Metal transporter cnnm-4; AltName: Full=CNNM family homolog 4 [Caenorhabditis elegans]CAA95784.3 Metal transporter cnnm-4 [Caenorhabditis elegans]|eukprot:NP_492040.3 Metal transporter cnnm-4 [Caenorhabditis elegans]